MRRALAIACLTAFLVFGVRCTHSTSGLFVFGLGPALLLDRYVFGCLPWPKPISWRKEMGVRAAYLVAGTVTAYVVRLGLVPWTEALFVGIGLTISGFLVECLVCLIGKVFRIPWSSWTQTCCSGLLFLGLLGIAAPLKALHPLRTVPKRTPAAVGLAYEEVHFVASDGTKLAGWLVPHSSARGNVIFCHGHGRNREQGTGFLPTLHELGFNVLAFDFRGHGDSAGHTATFGRHEVEDLVAAEAFLSCRYPDKPVFLIGVSYGAAVALQALPSLPAVRGVWCEGCFGRFLPVVENQFSMLPSTIRYSVVSAYQMLAWLDCGMWGPDISPGARLQQVRIPIYFCHGLEDTLVPFAEGRRLYEGYDGPKERYWVQGANHYDVRRKNKDEYLRRLRGFLTENLVAGRDGTLVSFGARALLQGGEQSGMSINRQSAGCCPEKP